MFTARSLWGCGLFVDRGDQRPVVVTRCRYQLEVGVLGRVSKIEGSLELFPYPFSSATGSRGWVGGLLSELYYKWNETAGLQVFNRFIL